MSRNNVKRTETEGGDEIGGENFPTTPPRRKKRPGEIFRENSLYSAPTIIIVYPLVGYFLGWLLQKYLGWPWWVSLITMIMGLIQAIREIFNLSKKVYGNGDNKGG